MSAAFDPLAIGKALPDLWTALPVTLELAVSSTLLGLGLGALFTWARLANRPLIAPASAALVSFLRGTPPLVQLFLVYYGLPLLLKPLGIDFDGWSKLWFAIVTFSLNAAGFFSENLRAAYLAVDPGQREAALSVGLTPFQAFVRIVGPQAVRVALPNLGNGFIGLLKETSLAYSIGVMELTGRAQVVAARGYGARQLEIFIAVALIYWVVCIGLERLLVWAEARAGRSLRRD